MLPKNWTPGKGENIPIDKIIVPKVRYAVGIHDNENGIGFQYGPFLQIEQALEIVPSDDKACIFLISGENHFSALLYKWRSKKCAWFLIDKEYHWLYHPESNCVFIDVYDDRAIECDDYGVVSDFDQDETNKIYATIFGENNIIIED